MDGGLRYDFGPCLTYSEWFYVHVGVDMEVVTVVGAKYAWASFDCLFLCEYG